MILLTGATGTVGGHLLSTLAAQGAPVRALVRSQERADSLRGYDCEITIGSYEDPDSLDHALRRVDRVFLVTAGGPDLAAQELAMVRAIRAAATSPHVVKVAAAGVDAAEPWTRIQREHLRVTQALAEAEVPTTVLAPGVFFQNLLRSVAGMRERGVISAPAGDTPLTWVDARDIAAVAAHVLTSDGHEGATYTVTGPEQLPYAELARRLSAATGLDVRYEDVAPERFRADLVAAGTPEWNADALVELYEGYRAGRGPAVTDEVTKATGRDAATLEDFLTHHMAAFR